jgi:hypothetical protein
MSTVARQATDAGIRQRLERDDRHDAGPAQPEHRRRRPRTGSKTARVVIDVPDAGEGGELVECLWRHGIPASLRERASGWRVEVRSSNEQPGTLITDVDTALRRWRPNAEASVLGSRAGTAMLRPRLELSPVQDLPGRGDGDEGTPATRMAAVGQER